MLVYCHERSSAYQNTLCDHLHVDGVSPGKKYRPEISSNEQVNAGFPRTCHDPLVILYLCVPKLQYLLQKRKENVISGRICFHLLQCVSGGLHDQKAEFTFFFKSARVISACNLVVFRSVK